MSCNPKANFRGWSCPDCNAYVNAATYQQYEHLKICDKYQERMSSFYKITMIEFGWDQDGIWPSDKVIVETLDKYLEHHLKFKKAY